MGKVIFEHPDDDSKTVEVMKGHTILRAAKQGRVALRHKCGGRASCTTCKVFIEDQAGVSSANQKEQYKLGQANLAQGLRLSCQTKVYGTIHARIPEDPYKARIRQLLKQAGKSMK